MFCKMRKFAIIKQKTFNLVHNPMNHKVVYFDAK